MLLDGAGMDLHFTETRETVELRPGNRCARFVGTEAVLVDGATTVDCNLIWRRDAYQVTVHEGTAGAAATRRKACAVSSTSSTAESSLDGAVAGAGDLLVGDLGEPLPGGCTGHSLAFLLAPPGCSASNRECNDRYVAFRAFTVRPRSTWSTSGEPVLGARRGGRRAVELPFRMASIASPSRRRLVGGHVG